MPAAPNYFVGLPVELDAHVLARLGSPPRGVRLFARDDIHLTLAFLGRVDEPRARRAFELANEVPLAPIAVTLGQVVPLGNPRRPSALSATVMEGHEALRDAIAAMRDRMLVAAELEPERRAPLPHVTLARVQRKATHAEHRAALEWAQTLDLAGATARISRVALYTWNDDRREKLFRILASEPLVERASIESGV